LSVTARIWILVGFLVLLHFSLHVAMGLRSGAPDLLTVALLLAAREVGMARAAALGFVFGLLEDALSVIGFGANTLAMTIVGMSGAFTRELFVGDTRLFVISYFALGTLMRDLLHWVMLGEDLRRSFVEQVLVQGTVGGLYAAAVAFVLLTVSGLTRVERA